MITFILLAALSFPAQQSRTLPETTTAVTPEQVLAWQLEGLTQEEIQEEVNERGLTERPDEALLSALSAAGADAETIRTVQLRKAPRKIWKLGLRLPSPTDYLYEIAGAILFNNGARALQTIQNEVEEQPRNPDVRLIYAQITKVQEDWITAYAQATAAVKLAPESPYAHAMRSTVCYHSGLVECATREALLFVEMRADDAAAYIILGHAREMQGRHEEALQAYGKAETLHPAYSAIYAGRGDTYHRMGDFGNAVKAYEQAIRMEEQNPEYYFELARVYLEEGYTKRGIEQLKKAKELAPGRLKILMALGNAYLTGEQYAAAIAEYQEVLEAAPDTEAARVQMAKALRAEGRTAQASQLLLDSSAGPGGTRPR